MHNKLTHLERSLQRTVEETIGRLYPSAQFVRSLANQLLKILSDDQPAIAGGSPHPSYQVVIKLSPHAAKRLQREQVNLQNLARDIANMATNDNHRMVRAPIFHIEEDHKLGPAEFTIETILQSDLVEQTEIIPLSTQTGENLVLQNIFLIVDGQRVYQLAQPVVNIGRRNDNHLVVSDMRVSRIHAQLRASHGQYTVFDLDSSGGTFVNGERVKQQLLHPGDIISLAGFELIYGQDTHQTAQEQLEKTHPMKIVPQEKDKHRGSGTLKTQF